MSEGRIQKSAKNMVTGFMYQGMVLILSFVSRSVFIYTLGTEYLGLNGIFSDVLSLLSMADLGFGTAMAYSFYKPLAEHDEERITALVSFYRKIYNIIAATVTGVGVLCIPFLKYIVNTEKDIPYLEVYYLFSLAGVVISYLFVYKTTLLTADQKNYKIVKINMWTSLIRTILQIVALLLLRNYVVYLSIGIVFQFISNVIASRKTEKEYPYIRNNVKKGTVEKELKDNIFSNMKSVFIYKLSGTMFNATDNIIISSVVGTVVVGFYSNYLMISNKLLLIEQIVFSALTASIGNVIVKEAPKKRLQIFNAMQSASFIFCGIITSAFCVLVNDMIKVWLGADFMLPFITVIAISLNTYLACVLQPLWIYRDATGLYMKTKYIMLIGAIVNVVLSVVLGYHMGLPGIIFASAIARISTYLWYEPKLLFQEYFESSVWKYYLSLFINIVLVAGTIGICMYAGRYFAVSGWGSLIIKAAVIGSICCIVFLVAYMRSEGFKIIWEKVKGFIHK